MVAEAFYPDPQKLYDPDPEYIPPLHHKYGPYVGGIGTGIAIHVINNYWRKRPYRTAIYMYPIYAGIFGFAFDYLSKTLKRYYSRRDTIYKHYIMLHPEDFPPPPKIKIGELLEDWQPTR